MIRITLTLVLLLSSYAIQAQTLQGTLKQHVGQTIHLTGFNYTTTEQLSTTTIDSLGNFSLTYPANYRGLGLLKTQDGSTLLLVLDKEAISLKGTHLKEQERITFYNSSQNQLFVKISKRMGLNMQSYAAWRYLQKLYNLPGFKHQKKVLKSIETELQRIENNNATALQNVPKNKYIGWYAPLRKLLDDMPQTISNYRERIPSNIADFRKIDFTNPNFKTSGLFKQLIQGHYLLLENSGQPSDSITAQMNISTRYLIAHLKDNTPLLNRVAKDLFSLFEKRSLFKASSFLALRLLAEHYAQLTPALIHKFEGYRILKVGAIAPDIQLDANTKLSDIQQTTLLVFVASWCPDCKLANEQLYSHYKRWKEKKGIEIVYISIDTDRQAFKDGYTDAPWAVYSDFKGWDSKAVQHYHVIGTPSYFLLEKNRKILSRPKSVAQIDAIVSGLD